MSVRFVPAIHATATLPSHGQRTKNVKSKGLGNHERQIFRGTLPSIVPSVAGGGDGDDQVIVLVGRG